MSWSDVIIYFWGCGGVMKLIRENYFSNVDWETFSFFGWVSWLSHRSSTIKTKSRNPHSKTEEYLIHGLFQRFILDAPTINLRSEKSNQVRFGLFEDKIRGTDQRINFSRWDCQTKFPNIQFMLPLYQGKLKPSNSSNRWNSQFLGSLVIFETFSPYFYAVSSF